MVSTQAQKMYRQNQANANIHPVKLIDMMYERTLLHLDLAEKGVEKKDAKMRGENLSKAIALVTELNASVKEDDSSEAAQFLRGLYAAILLELPKVSISNDSAAIRQSKTYIAELRRIWSVTAMEEAGFKPHSREKQEETENADFDEVTAAKGTSGYRAKRSGSDIIAQQSLSVSI